MPVYNLTLNLGSNEEGRKRREAYDKVVKKEKLSMNEWAKKILDIAANIKIVKE